MTKIIKFLFGLLSLCLANGVFADTLTAIDPWIIAEREEISLALLNCTRIPALFGDDNLGNILWGLEIQRSWQIKSGRQQSKPSLTTIDELAWFADINYYLTVVPYIVAIKSNLLPPIEMKPPKSNAAKFPITYETIDPETTQKWTTFFETIKLLQENSSYTTLENLQKILWSAHAISVSKALPLFQDELNLLNVKERKFSNGFGNFVDLLAIMNLNTSYPPINELNKLFPQRRLNIFDTPPLILDMTPQQNFIVLSYFVVSDMVTTNIWDVFLETMRKGLADINCAAKLRKAFNPGSDGSYIAALTSIYATC